MADTDLMPDNVGTEGLVNWAKQNIQSEYAALLYQLASFAIS